MVVGGDRDGRVTYNADHLCAGCEGSGNILSDALGSLNAAGGLIRGPRASCGQHTLENDAGEDEEAKRHRDQHNY